MKPWSRVSQQEYAALGLRAHQVLSGAPVHDVWRVFLPERFSPATMVDVRAVAAAQRATQKPGIVVRFLFGIRRTMGSVFGWDRSPTTSASRSFRPRLTDADRASSLVPPGTHDGPFHVLYVHDREAVSEIANATVHAFLVWSLQPRTGGYHLYWAIHVLPVSRLTRWYMALIDPFRRWLVYPSLLRQFHEAWMVPMPARATAR